MTSPAMKPLTDPDIKEFLENAPLYVWREFRKPALNRSSLWITEIDVFCETCDQLQALQDLRSRGGGAGMPVEALKTGTSYFEFTCVSCRKAKREYLVDQIVGEETIGIQNPGNVPENHLREIAFYNAS